MLISEIRKERIEESIVKGKLQLGRIPSPGDIAMSLKSEIYAKDLDKPLFDYVPVAANTKVLSPKYNEDVALINQDIDDALTALKVNQENAYSVFNYFNIRKSKLEAEINAARKRIEELVLNSKVDMLKGCFVEPFNTMATIDQSNTTATVDIVNHFAAIPCESKRFEINSSNTQIGVASTTGNGITNDILSGNLSDILLKDNETAWQYQISTLTQITTEVTINVNINKNNVPELGSAKINGLSVAIQSIKPTYVKVYAKTDKYNLIFEKQSYGKETINVPLYDDSTSFRIVLSKLEADKITTDQKTFQYIYELTNISFMYNEYTSGAVLYSQPIPIPQSATKFSLDSVHDLPNGGQIDYLVQTQGINRNVWTEISSFDDEYSLENHVQASKTFSFNSKEAIENTRSVPALTTNGMKFYSLGTLSEDLIQASAVLYRGINCWRVDKYILQHDAQFIPSLENFDDSLKVTSYSKTTLRKSLVCKDYPVGANMNIQFSCSIYCEDETSIPARLTCIPKHSMYVNDTLRHYGENSTNVPVTIILNRGWNTISIVCYCPGATNISIDIFSQELDNVISQMYGDKAPMRQLSIHDLRYNTHINDRDAFAFYKDTTNNIILNHYYSDIDYKLDFSYTTVAVTTSLVVKAIFKQENGLNSTPSIKSYTVRFL